MKILNIILYFLIIFNCAIGVSCGSEIIDKIVAVVNDDIITQSEVEEYMGSFLADYQLRYGYQAPDDVLESARSDALNRLIEEKLILQEAKRRNIEVDEAEVDERIQEIKNKFPSTEQFESMVESSGMTINKLKDKYREQIRMRKLINGIVSYNIKISPTQIAAYYEGHKDEFMQPSQVKLKIILLKFKPDVKKIEVRALADGLLQRIRAGEDFTAIAKQYSDGPNKELGGDMGFVSKGQMIAEIDKVAFSLNENDVSNIIETSLGCNILKVERKIPAVQLSLSEATPMVKERLFGREAELVLREFISNLRENAFVNIK